MIRFDQDYAVFCRHKSGAQTGVFEWSTLFKLQGISQSKTVYILKVWDNSWLARFLKIDESSGGPGLSSLGVPGVPWHTQILADQLTLFQPGGTDYAHLIITGTPWFSDLPTALGV